jgi:DNA-binding MarR family transcriptional regulator
MDDAPPDVIAFPVLLRFARAAYVRAIRAAQAEAGCDDMPRDGTYVIGAMANGAMPLSDVIEELGMSKQAAGQLVDTLVLRGYIDRSVDPNDRRRLTLTLTERGLAVADATRSAIQGVDAELVARVGAEHVAITRATLAAMHGLGWNTGEAAKSPKANHRVDGKRIDDASFHNCSMRNATFDDVNLAESDFWNVNLSGAQFRNVNMSGVTIDNAKIDGLTIFGHDVQSLIRADIQRGKSA